MKNQYDRFLKHLETDSEGKGFRVIQPDILLIGEPGHLLVVPRPFTPEETDLWVAKYGGLVRPGFAEEEPQPQPQPLGTIQKTFSTNERVIKI